MFSLKNIQELPTCKIEVIILLPGRKMLVAENPLFLV
jgi:hypothetical protein